MGDAAKRCVAAAQQLAEETSKSLTSARDREEALRRLFDQTRQLLDEARNETRDAEASELNAARHLKEARDYLASAEAKNQVIDVDLESDEADGPIDVESDEDEPPRK